jgi:hypothetical protein
MIAGSKRFDAPHARTPRDRVLISTKRRPSSSSVETLAVEPGRCHFSVYRNIAIGVWVAQADRAAAEAALRVAREMALRCPGRHSSVAFLVDGLPGPLPEAIPALSKLWEKRPDLACSAMIIEGAGFWASGLRSMINNMRREAGGDVRVNIGSSIEQVVDWLSAENARLTGQFIAPAELADALAFARKHGEQIATVDVEPA